MDELILLPEEQAVETFFDDLDRVALMRLLAIVSLVSILGMVVFLAKGMHLRILLPVVTLVIARILFSLSHRPFFERWFRPILIVYLVTHLLAVRLVVPPLGEGIYHPLDFLLPLVPAFFCLRQPHLLLVLFPLWGLSAGRDLAGAMLSTAEGTSLQVPQLIAVSMVSIGAFFWVSRRTQNRRREFLLVWRREHQRHRERRRMSEELDEARRIQLSMLPRSDPSHRYFDIAGISIPASEVGGDYYEYFQSADDRQAVVIADVAGHGVASGLLLAGVRSCLYLLKDEDREPGDVLSRLDRVVRETTGRREFVTMLYALFDPKSGRVVLASAAHPPLLRYVAATGEVEEVEISSLPLGTRLRQAFHETTVPYAADDIFLLYTDGIAETVSGHGELYGNERFRNRLRSMAHDRTAREIRDTLLGDVWSFKADGEQTDDITLVVVKIR